MDNLKLGYHSIEANYGYFIDKVPLNILDILGRQVTKIQNNFNKEEKWNNYLVGEIEHEYKINYTPEIKNYLKELVNQIEINSNYLSNNCNKKINLTFINPELQKEDLWVNFQKKYEYNPMHTHIGTYSFVIWYKVPYLIEEERRRIKYKDNKKSICHGQFQFITNQFGIIALNIDKSKEGYISIFPSNLNHTVYPFYTSDEYRISIAGNIHGDCH